MIAHYRLRHIELMALSAVFGCGSTTADNGGPNDSGVPEDVVEAPELVPPPYDEVLAVRWLVGAGLQLSCAQPKDGDVRCWGRRFAEDGVAVPTARLETLDLGDWIHCGLLESGRPSCFGSPWTSISPDEDLLDVSTGYGHFCGIRGSDAGLVCWTLDDAADEPALHPPEGSFADVDSGYGFSCALTLKGHARCWGRDDGRLDAPDERFATLSLGPDYGCGLTMAGEVRCWGAVSSPNWAGPFALVAAGGWGICALRASGELICSGDASLVAPSTTSPLRQIAVGNRHACAISTTGRVACWGDVENVDDSTLAVPTDLLQD